MEQALEHLHNKLERLLAEFDEMRQQHKEIVAENHLLHEKIGQLQEKNALAGDKIQRMLEQLKSMQEVS